MIADSLPASSPTVLPPRPPERVPPFLGDSEPMREVHDRIAAAARTDSPVLIHGESGTGKTRVAHLIHARSDRRDSPLVVLDCRALERDAVERAFGSGPDNAVAGTLCLEEIAGLPRDTQTRLVQALAAPKGDRPRIIATSTQSPDEVAASNVLQRDLYYRLHVRSLPLPPLRNRTEDILPLADHMLAQLPDPTGRLFTRIDDGAGRILMAHPWPGNLRQLFSILEEIAALQIGPVLNARMLERLLLPAPADSTPGATLGRLIGQPMTEIERAVIEATITHMGGSVPKAAQVLGVAPSTLYRKREGWRDN